MIPNFNYCIHFVLGCKHTSSLGPVEEDVDTEEPEKHIDLTPQTSMRRVSLSRQYKKRKSGGPRLRQTQRHVDIRVGILDKSHTGVLSNTGKCQTSC